MKVRNSGLNQFKHAKLAKGILLSLGMISPAMVGAQTTTETEDAQVETIEVKGLRASVISAQETKMNSDKIMDGISADDIGALPDRSVTETLQRVAGVAIDRYMSLGDPEHFSVEGNGVIVRGLTQVRSELNGRSTFSADGGRTLSFGDVPPELLSAVNVYKSPSADQIEGGLAGTIDLETRLPFHNDEQQISFDITANYGDVIQETKPAFSILYSNNWDTSAGKIGFLFDIAKSELSTRNDSMYVRPFFYRDDINGMRELQCMFHEALIGGPCISTENVLVVMRPYNTPLMTPANLLSRTSPAIMICNGVKMRSLLTTGPMAFR